MKVAHLILAYKYPEQLDKLIDIMSIDEFTFFVHLDKKIDYKDFEFISARRNVIFIKNRVEITWGSFSMNRAITESFKEILEHDEYDYISVITSFHLPVKLPHEIYNYLSENKGFQFFNYIPYDPENYWWKRCERRILKYSLIGWKIPGKYKIEKIINILSPNRKFPSNYEVVGSPTSLFLTSDCVKYILNEFNKSKTLINFFKYVWGSDEFIFATIIYNSRFKEKIKECLVHIEFSDENDGHSKVMQTVNFNTIKKSGKFFAKRFDPYIDKEIIEMVNDLRNGITELN
jgi:hypothetical protein